MRFVIQSYGSKFLQCFCNVVAMLGNVGKCVDNVNCNTIRENRL